MCLDGPKKNGTKGKADDLHFCTAWHACAKWKKSRLLEMTFDCKDLCFSRLSVALAMTQKDDKAENFAE